VDLSRRKFLEGSATGAAGTALAGGVLLGGAHADANTATRGGPADAADAADAASYPFHGINQSGVLTPGPAGKQAFTCVAAFDSVAADKPALAGLLRTVTSASDWCGKALLA
jgi:deferrochelatase/peroxidase EfeB